MFHKRGWLISRSLSFSFSFRFFFFFFLGGGKGGKRRRKGMITTFGIDPFRGVTSMRGLLLLLRMLFQTSNKIQ